MKRSYIITLIILVLVAFVASVMTWYVREQAILEEANEAADTLFKEGSDSPYIDQNGNSVGLAEYLGQIIVVNSWASWSPFSVDELQALNTFAGEYRDKNVVVIAINRKESKEQAERFLATLPPLDNLKIVIDTEDYFYGAVGGFAMPETLYYDQLGTIVTKREGAVSIDDTKRIVDEIIFGVQE
jgi:thiol-disulfide isomerase/thioredoxin